MGEVLISVCVPLKNPVNTRLFASIATQTHASYEVRVSTVPGIFVALNTSLRESQGDILYFACDDDALMPWAFAKVAENMPLDKPAWLYGRTIVKDQHGVTLGEDGAPTTYEQLAEHNRIGQPSCFWNRHMLNAVGLFAERYHHAADYQMWLRMWQITPPIFIDTPLGVHTRHAQQHSQLNAAALEAEAREISAWAKS